MLMANFLMNEACIGLLMNDNDKYLNENCININVLLTYFLCWGDILAILAQ